MVTTAPGRFSFRRARARIALKLFKPTSRRITNRLQRTTRARLKRPCVTSLIARAGLSFVIIATNVERVTSTGIGGNTNFRNVIYKRERLFFRNRAVVQIVWFRNRWRALVSPQLQRAFNEKYE